MRWRFADPRNEAENADRRAILDEISRWWDAFSERAGWVSEGFSQGSVHKIGEWTSSRLDRIDHRLMFEYGPALKAPGHRLCITCESARALRPLVAHLLSRAPELPGWEFYGYRLAENVERARDVMMGRVGLALDSTWNVSARNGRHNLVDLVFILPPGQDVEQKATSAAFVAAEALLGEERLDHWIGGIEVSGNSVEDPSSLDALPNEVSARIESICASLDGRPHAQRIENAVWSTLEMSPTEAEDYPCWSDLYVAATMNLDVWFAAHEGAAFSSRRFSRCGEVFAYVKLDGAHWPVGGPDRFTLEDALGGALTQQGLGAVMGGGTGLRYSYIDLALLDVDRAVTVVAEALRREGAGQRSWVMFFDADWAAEWVGVYPDTPPPYGLPE